MEELHRPIIIKKHNHKAMSVLCGRLAVFYLSFGPILSFDSLGWMGDSTGVVVTLDPSAGSG